MSKKKIKVAVGMSGGVDSSVCTILLKEMGYELTGISMQIYDKGMGSDLPRTHACYGPDEEEVLERAESLCKRLGIPFHRIDLRKEFKEHVISYFRREYLSGRTPNPCIMCNRLLKFDFLIKKARDHGIQFDYFATGHYAIVEKTHDGRYLLKKAHDRSKDQSYFLYRLTHEQLGWILFPLGRYLKRDVIKMATNMELDIESMKESQDFVSGGDYSFLFKRDEIPPGDIVDTSGKRLGTHRGIIYYTVGQRKGLGISSSRPLYVKMIDPDSNTIIVGDKKEVYSHRLIAGNLNLIGKERIDGASRFNVKIRLNHKDAPATVYPSGDGKIRVVFDEPQLAITPGQSAVIYDGDTVIGGGIIESAW